jgi:hypothetical protein
MEVDTGLRDAGYVYVNIDDCWTSHREPGAGGAVQVEHIA